MGIEYKYDAFISYRHVSPDKEIAEKLQKKLESYKPPKVFRNLEKRGGWRIFRDETELPTSSDLSNDIKTALKESQFLIVICSKTTKNSRWCMEEIEYFKELHNGSNSNIITLVADGNPEDVFPQSLCNELIPVTDEHGNTTYHNHIIEPLAANVADQTLKGSLKKLNTEFLRIAAPLLGCGYDSLYNREHKKKIRRIFTIGSIVIALLLLFGIYNSAMLWKINNQKAELAFANKNLQTKTDELNQSNKELKRINKELEVKTKEAKENLAEAEKQRKIAEDNLAEAEKQRKIAEDNLAEAEKQRKIAEDNLAEANKQKAIAEANEKEANKQKKIAEDNLAEANKQKAIAEANEKEANKQKKTAEDNLAEANKQKAIAETNEKEANTQRGIAEENMRIAQENEASANDANKKLKIKTSETLANQAQIYLGNDDIAGAVKTALESLSLIEGVTPSNGVAENILINATNAYSRSDKMLCIAVKLSGYVNFLEFSADGSHILATDNNGIIYIIDYQTGAIIKTYTPLEIFGEISSISDICVDGNTGFVLCKGQVISINLTDGTINWHYKKDHNDYVYFSELVTNTVSENIVLSGGSYPIAISKSTGIVSSSFDKNNENAYGSWYDFSYLSSDDKLYIADTGLKNITVYNIKDNSKTQYALDIPDDCDILSMGENANSIFLNIKTTDNFEKIDNALLICFDKNDMSVKWKTEYTGDYISPYDLNKIFEFTHRIPDASGEYFDTTGIIVVSGCNVLAFDKETGKVYFKTAQSYDDEILYCEPNEGYSLKIATSKMFSPLTFLYVGNNSEISLSAEDFLWTTGGSYNFDKERKYITYAEDNKFALASADSSEISIYNIYKNSNYTLLSKAPTVEYMNFKICADNSKGIFAGYNYTYKDEQQNYLTFYDINNDKLLSYQKISRDIDKMYFIGNDTLFTIDRNDYATAFKTDGSLAAEGDISALICQAVGNQYAYTRAIYIYPTDKGLLYCTGDGIFQITISNNHFVLKNIFYSKNLSDYSITNDFASFTKKDYINNICKIVYFKNGDSHISIVQENGEDASFKRDSVSSVITNSNYQLAFISKEGFIGLYKYGDEKISRILLPPSEVAPLKIIFTPDAEYIIAMCSNGEFIKYSTETLQEVDRYASTLKVDSYSELEFVDESTFMAKKYATGDDFILVDYNTMDLKAEIDDCFYFMKQDKKMLFRLYMDGEYKWGYHNYLSTKELIDFANNFLNQTGNQ